MAQSNEVVSLFLPKKILVRKKNFLPQKKNFKNARILLFLQGKFFLTLNSEKTKNGESTKNVVWTTNLHENGEKNFQTPASTRSTSLKNPGGGITGFPLGFFREALRVLAGAWKLFSPFSCKFVVQTTFLVFSTFVVFFNLRSKKISLKNK